MGRVGEVENRKKQKGGASFYQIEKKICQQSYAREGMAEKCSRDTKQDGHDFNPRTGLVLRKVLYTQNLTIIRSTPHRKSFSP